MTTAPTPSRADALIREHRASMHPETLRAWASDAVDELGRLQAAERTLQRLGYQDRGGQEWAPPIGKAPDFDLIDSLRARITELEGKLGRFQGVPLPLIEAINAATGSNEWQGDHSPAELLEPGCRAIEALQAERDEADRRAGAAERSAAAFHENNQRFEQVRRRMKEQWGVHDNVSFDIVWQQALDAKQALAELEARKPLPLSDEQIDAIADGMPGGRGGFMKTWGWRQFARKILDLRAPPTWEPGFDCMVPGQEELAIQFCLEIAGPRGQPGRNPDPVRLLEMAEALYKAEVDARPKET